MKRNFKGFTLIECVVAMAILGIASLIIAQIYAGVSSRNKMNKLVNTSLSNQMAYVEKYTDSETLPLYYGGSRTTKDTHSVGASGDGQPPHKVNSVNNNESSYLQADSTYTYEDFKGATFDNTYSYSADVYILYSRTQDDQSLDAAGGDWGYTESNYNLRYKYILGHSNG